MPAAGPDAPSGAGGWRVWRRSFYRSARLDLSFARAPAPRVHGRRRGGRPAPPDRRAVRPRRGVLRRGSCGVVRSSRRVVSHGAVTGLSSPSSRRPRHSAARRGENATIPEKMWVRIIYTEDVVSHLDLLHTLCTDESTPRDHKLTRHRTTLRRLQHSAQNARPHCAQRAPPTTPVASPQDTPPKPVLLTHSGQSTLRHRETKSSHGSVATSGLRHLHTVWRSCSPRRHTADRTLSLRRPPPSASSPSPPEPHGRGRRRNRRLSCCSHVRPPPTSPPCRRLTVPLQPFLASLPSNNSSTGRPQCKRSSWRASQCPFRSARAEPRTSPSS